MWVLYTTEEHLGLRRPDFGDTLNSTARISCLSKRVHHYPEAGCPYLRACFCTTVQQIWSHRLGALVNSVFWRITRGQCFRKNCACFPLRAEGVHSLGIHNNPVWY